MEPHGVADEPAALFEAERLRLEVVVHEVVGQAVRGLLQVEVAGEALQIHDSRVTVGEREDAELPRGTGVGSCGVGKDLHGDVRLGTEAVQMFELFAHDVGGADGAV